MTIPIFTSQAKSLWHHLKPDFFWNKYTFLFIPFLSRSWFCVLSQDSATFAYYWAHCLCVCSSVCLCTWQQMFVFFFTFYKMVNMMISVRINAANHLHNNYTSFLQYPYNVSPFKIAVCAFALFSATSGWTFKCNNTPAKTYTQHLFLFFSISFY